MHIDVRTPFADRRRAEIDRGAKRRKDLLQARRLIKLLREDKPDLLKASLEDALSRGPSWRRHIEASRTADPEVGRLLDGL